jgi:hypothetical protein
LLPDTLVHLALLEATAMAIPKSSIVPPHISRKIPSAIGELQSQVIGFPLYPPLMFVTKQYRYFVYFSIIKEVI